MSVPASTDDSLVTRAEVLYEQHVRPLVDTPANHGKMVIVDAVTGDYEVDNLGIDAAKRLLKRHTDGQLYGFRIGYDAAESFGGSTLESKP